MAFFAAYMTGIDAQGRFFINLDTEEGHVAMVPSWFTTENLIDFINVNHEDYGAYSERNSYHSFNTMWGNECDEDSWGGRDGVRQPNGVPIQLNELWCDVLVKHQNKDDRVAIFDHAFNKRRHDNLGNMQATKALPLFAKILNEYRGGLKL